MSLAAIEWALVRRRWADVRQFAAMVVLADACGPDGVVPHDHETMAHRAHLTQQEFASTLDDLVADRAVEVCGGEIVVLFPSRGRRDSGPRVAP